MSEKGGQEQPGQQRRSLAAAPLLLWKGCPWPPAGQKHGAAPGGRGRAAVGTARQWGPHVALHQVGSVKVSRKCPVCSKTREGIGWAGSGGGRR